MDNLQLLFEDWRYIQRYEGLYLISSRGRIISLPRLVKNGRSDWYYTKQRELKARPTMGGYVMVQLSKKNTPEVFQIHRLVAIAYIPNPQNLPFVNHIKGNKKDNKWFMLEWCTPLYNVHHAIAMGVMKNPPVQYGKDNCKARKVIDNNTGKVYDTIRDAMKDLKISRCKADKILAGKHSLLNNLKFYQAA